MDCFCLDVSFTEFYQNHLKIAGLVYCSMSIFLTNLILANSFYFVAGLLPHN